MCVFVAVTGIVPLLDASAEIRWFHRCLPQFPGVAQGKPPKQEATSSETETSPHETSKANQHGLGGTHFE